MRLPWVPCHVAEDIARQLSHHLDLNGDRLGPKSISAYRNLYIESRLKVWRRIQTEIDPSWHEDDPNNMAWTHVAPPGKYKDRQGVRPEDIIDPDLRADYERRIKENVAKGERNIRQSQLRSESDRWLKNSLKGDMISMYGQFPVAPDDWEMLKAYLRVYVASPVVREELFSLAQAAAKDEPNKEPPAAKRNEQ